MEKIKVEINKEVNDKTAITDIPVGVAFRDDYGNRFIRTNNGGMRGDFYHFDNGSFGTTKKYTVVPATITFKG